MPQNAKQITVTTAIILLSLFLVTGAGTGACADEPAEYQVKAAFLYNFAKFVEWPQAAFGAPDSPFIFGVLGDDPFGGALDVLTGKTVKGRKIIVKRFTDVHDIGVCHVLFISHSESGRMEEIITASAGAPILMVGDMKHFVRRGGMIGFLMEQNKVVFEINETAARRAGLGISSQLLKLARTVY